MPFRCLCLTITLLLNFSLPNFAQQQPIVLRHGGTVQTVQFSPVNNSLLASAGDNNTIKLWNLRNDTVTTLRGHTRPVNAVAFSPDGQLLVSGGDDWTFRLWNIRRGQHIATLEHITDRTRSSITDVAFSPNGQLLATAGVYVKLWEVSTQNEIATLRHDEDIWVFALAFSPNGQLLATGHDGGIVKIWDVQKRQVITQLKGDTTGVYAVTFSPDSRTLASSGYDGQIKLWATSDWALLGTLQNRGTAYTLDFFPDGKTLVSTGHAAVKLWSVESGEEIVSLTGHPAWIRGAAVSPNGSTLASGGDDGTVRVQNIESYLQNQQQREMVRLIYFLPLNRRAQRDIDTKLDTLIKDAQQFYAEQMRKHGFGRKTFTFETDATGQAVVHRVNGRFTDRYYNVNTFDKVTEEIEQQFDLSKNLYLIAVETASEMIDVQWCGQGGVHGTAGGKAIVPASGSCFVGDFGVDTTAHELGHAFGLEHDFRNDTYLMSYGSNRNRLSSCAAEWLNAHRYFNTSETSFDEPATIEMLTPLALPANTIRFRFEVTDVDGLHQAQLIVPVAAVDPADGTKLHSCEALNGGTNLIGFTTTGLRPGPATEVKLKLIDVHGNFTEETYLIETNTVARVDVNRNGVVDVDDLVLVASSFGRRISRWTNPNPDVNKDGIVNREDLLLVADALESEENLPAAPALATANLQRWIVEAKLRNPGDAAFQKGIAALERLLMPLHPTETALLPNYPNPFNPETWIPYQLAEPADVGISIYTADGKLVRTLELGNQPVGVYESRSRAAYWDGKNALGEPVASGIYFSTLTAGEFIATRKLLIRK